ncbi:reverse transcriptase domain-containing protein [Thioalkalivibrio sp. AKL12]|uniref:reverse transcriptase domain-containing protein n=1 Tax=Thioalkalivibrio sp. AKL12 TaxID=1158159 RepID=UPI00039E1DA7|nr:reverse transcriptase domain-containing protein [Thioalkalivibrio sp. AKL12]
MSFRELLEREIKQEAEKLTNRYHAYHNALHIEFSRNRDRFLNPPKKEIYKPDYWGHDRKFNPFYVRANSRSIAKSISRKISAGVYAPYPPHVHKVPKSDGGVRDVNIFQIPDAAVSSIYYRRLLYKNKHRFSAFSYAYRNDRNVHFAIQDAWVDIAREARTFVAEFDFSDFFGSISHSYLFDQFDQNGFVVSEEERRIVRSFLDGTGSGIPQGTSLSLFLANIVCWRLDLGFEREGLKFARYADDTLIWDPDYSKICRAFSLINNFSDSAGVPINARKSNGIRLLSREGLPVELSNPATKVDFLGYSISVDAVSIKEEKISRIKREIGLILYRNLILPLRGRWGGPRSLRVGELDPEFVRSIMQVRRYLYGELNEDKIRKYISGRARSIKFKGLMSFYPLVTNEKQLQELDGWLVSVFRRSLVKRRELLEFKGVARVSDCFPYRENLNNLPEVCRQHGRKVGIEIDVPSFLRIYNAIQKGIERRGVEGVMNPSSLDYEY